MNTNHISVSVWVKPFEYSWSGNPGTSVIINRYQYGYHTPVGEHWGIYFDEDIVGIQVVK